MDERGRAWRAGGRLVLEPELRYREECYQASNKNDEVIFGEV